MKDLSYDERMHRLRLPSLELRRLHLDLIFGYKVVFGLVCVNTDDLFEFNHAANTRGHTYKLFKSRSVNNISQKFFAERIVNVWNGLPPSVSFASLSAFRRSIQKVDFSQFMKCTWWFNFTLLHFYSFFLFNVHFLIKLFKVILFLD